MQFRCISAYRKATKVSTKCHIPGFHIPSLHHPEKKAYCHAHETSTHNEWDCIHIKMIPLCATSFVFIHQDACDFPIPWSI